VLASEGRWDSGALRSQGLDQEDAEAALREHGVDDVKETTLVELEPDGSISVVAQEGKRTIRPRRRTRSVKRP
jgi:uncharacterized membrane protein YcaP (DUF421 family)